ncbi:MAG: Type 1 glutamine amidotransferase-like domain-containing protein [Actinomycetota bacterium]|nr:Type 1 glutamine amidotransferase-like domain-containing protein [Actinomycetota bacterium]
MSIPGRIALVGSGEYLPVMQEIEGWLLEGRPKRYVQLATAAAPEGDESLSRWHELGSSASQRLGVEQVIVDVRDRVDADEDQWVQAIAGAGLIYLSGGNPAYLADTLRGSNVWQAIVQEWRNGASLAGCSAGAMAMGGAVNDFRHPRKGGVEGLGVLPEVRVLPHFDRLTQWMPDIALRPFAAKGAMTLGIDEDTALLGESDGSSMWHFRPRGRLSAWRIESSGKHRIEDSVQLRVN